MQEQGEVTVKGRVLAENTTLHEVYDSLLCEWNGRELVIETPAFLRKLVDPTGSKFYMIWQLTSSGTIDPKLLPYPENKAYTDEQKKQIALETLRSKRNLPSTTPEFTDEQIEDEVKAMDEKSKRKGATTSSEAFSTVKADFKDGKIVANEDADESKDSVVKKNAKKIAKKVR